MVVRTSRTFKIEIRVFEVVPKDPKDLLALVHDPQLHRDKFVDVPVYNGSEVFVTLGLLETVRALRDGYFESHAGNVILSALGACVFDRMTGVAVAMKKWFEKNPS
jgi:hypothetical protein